MSDLNASELHDGLRAWARGSYPLEAATELLIRTRNAVLGLPWIQWDDDAGRYWVDFASIALEVGTASGGERRLLLIAASLGTNDPDVTCDLNDAFSGLDRGNLDLVLAAIAHAGGSHQHSRMEKRLITPAGGQAPYEVDFPVIGGGYDDPLHPWPSSILAGQ